jgi:type II secretory ATPase GspE/PulE/Tfp pilus assembly ATPase PilB-like protein
VFEMMAISDDIRSLILHRAPSHDLRKVAVKHGMRSLREDGWRLLREGLTTVNEVMQNTKDEEAGGAFTESNLGLQSATTGEAEGR